MRASPEVEDSYSRQTYDVPANGWVRRTAAGPSLSTLGDAAPRVGPVVLQLAERAGQLIVNSLFSLNIQ